MSEETLSRVSIQVYGRVQGVWYRASAMERARDLNLVGFVSNKPDGTVYIEAQGPGLPLVQFMDWCKQGPPAARVDRLEINDLPVNLQESFFTIKR